ncbi:hypothetical protein F2Q68_00034007 [Brassica cretica]|uniref:Uncharacterized protein n=1 Tax=Brassica cretica TaxID=69181 RepID=A0A8S9HET9_BRACR|nr:hypothetical protein F2Q68_00034007 [Brassica cretica]
MHRSLLITGCFRDARNRSAISGSLKSSSRARVLAMGFNSSQSIYLMRSSPDDYADDLENLYTVYGVDCAVVPDLASASETPKTVRGGYFGAYLSFFQSCSLTFPIPEPILEILAELG